MTASFPSVNAFVVLFNIFLTGVTIFFGDVIADSYASANGELIFAHVVSIILDACPFDFLSQFNHKIASFFSKIRYSDTVTVLQSHHIPQIRTKIVHFGQKGLANSQMYVRNGKIDKYLPPHR